MPQTRSGRNMKPQVDIACHECDLLVALPKLSNGEKATCPRCSYVLTRYRDNAQEKLLALSLSGVVLLAFSLPFSFLAFDAQGNEKIVTLVESIQSIGTDVFWGVAAMLFATTLIIPGCFLLGLIYILISIRRHAHLPYTKPILRGLMMMIPWNMAEIFLVGILVSLIKIATLAKVSFGMSFLAYTLFIINLAATLMILDRYQIWQWVIRDNE